MSSGDIAGLKAGLAAFIDADRLIETLESALQWLH